MARARLLGSAFVLLVGFSALPGTPPAALAMAEADRLWTVGSRAFEDRLYSVSTRTLERFIERFPRDRRVAEATLLLGKTHLSQGALDAALEAFKSAQGFAPPPGRPEEAVFWQAETLLRMERFADARPDYERVLDNPAAPFTADALYGLGVVNVQLKRREQAVTNFQRLLAVFPQSPATHSATVYLARTLVELKRPGEAVPLLRSFTTKSLNQRLMPEARYLLGQALYDSGESREAVTELRAFAAAYPSNELAAQARRLATDTVMRSGTKAELADEYKQLMAQPLLTAEGLYNAGLVASRLNRPVDAEKVWTRLRKDFPEHALAARASLELAQGAFGRKAFKEAASLAGGAAKSTEDAVRVEGLVLLGESELKLKRYAAAQQAFRSAASIQGQEPALHFRALAGHGLALEEQGQWTQAAKDYDEVAARSPDKALRAWAKERRAALAAKLPAAPDAKPKRSTTPKGQSGSGGKP